MNLNEKYGELCRTSALRATINLSKFLNTPIGVEMLLANSLADKNESVVRIDQPVTGDITGNSVFLYPMSSALNMCDQLFNRKEGSTHSLQAEEKSALAEISNILIGSFLSALAQNLQLNSLLHQRPTIQNVTFKEICGTLPNASNKNEILTVISFYFSANAHCYFLLSLNRKHIEKLLHTKLDEHLADEWLLKSNMVSSKEEFENLIEWETAPIIKLTHQGKILNLNLAARSQVGLIQHLLRNKGQVEDQIRKMADKLKYEKIVITYLQTLQYLQYQYEVKLVSIPLYNTLFIELNDITHIKQVERELQLLGRELEKRVVQRTEELQLAKDKATFLAEKAVEASRLKSEFLANMSHELRTPLTAIIGFSELMSKEAFGALNNTYLEYVGDILTSARHLLQLINDILDLAKIESGSLQFYPEDIMIKQVLKEVIDILSPIYKSRNITIKEHISTKLKKIFLDKAKLKQILYNYISNAIKFSHDDSEIFIEITPRDNQCFMIAVQDTGIGIAKEDVEKLFQDFVQLDISTKKNYAGTGLGLSLTRHIVEAQHGQVGVYSELGTGSTFFAVLPYRFEKKSIKA